MTVVVETLSARTYVGRYDREDDGAVHLLDVGVHEAGSAMAKEKYIERSSKFGVRSEHRHLKVPTDQVVRITQLADWEQALPDR
jgi:hypothetical protein